MASPSEELTSLLEIRVADLSAYQDRGLRRSAIIGLVAESPWLPKAICPPGGDTRLSDRGGQGRLHKLMAYKDEYEVARLHRSAAFREALAEQFGADAQVTYKLHPPTLRALGMDSKIGLGRSGDVAFSALSRMKRLRGTALDPFGRTRHRRMERELIGEYESMLDRVLGALDSGNYDRAVELAELPDIVRGYEDIKEANVAEFRSRAQALLATF